MKSISVLTLCLLSLALHAKDKEMTPVTITTAKGDKITMSVQKERTVHFVNRQEPGTLMAGDIRPVTLNGRTLYYHRDHPKDEFSMAESKVWVDDYYRLKGKIDAAIKEEKAQLPDGDYEFKLKNMVVNEKGYIVYYETEGIAGRALQADKHFVEIPEATAAQMNKKIKAVIGDFKYTPFERNHVATPYLSNDSYGFQKGNSGAVPEKVQQAVHDQIKAEVEKHKK